MNRTLKQAPCSPHIRIEGAVSAFPVISAATLRCRPYKVLGLLHDAPIRAHQREASEKRHGTKTRLVGRRRRSGSIGYRGGVLARMGPGDEPIARSALDDAASHC